ncbi:hypothetical protein BI344_22530 [Chromobacterium sphagni]|uniref:PNPLA domain-containing protein n=2 Tax=Chromobacterium sphagni TaxID=1903179 RepID=A0ABX3CFC1_9NEIS|nr:hypothetical protein BI344_22530 [Chromobacterium sphagni]
MLAAALAKGVDAQRLPELFTTHGRDIFRTKLGWWPVSMLNLGLWGPRYSNRGLIETLQQEELLGEAAFQQLQHRLMIPALNLTQGKTRIFKTQHHPDYTTDGRVRLLDAVMASAAAPVFFPIYEFDNRRYADGGLVANSPALIAVHEAETKLGVDPSDIHLMMIGTRSTYHTDDSKAPLQRGIFGAHGWRFWKGWKANLIESTLSAQELLHQDMLRHKIEARLLHIDTSIKPSEHSALGLDKYSKHANGPLAGAALSEMQSISTKPLFRQWLSHTADTPNFF